MTDPTPTRDLPAIAAYAVAYDLDGEAAAAEWKLTTEAERVKHRMIADAAVTVASLHTAPPAALNPVTPPDLLALTGVYWDTYMASEPMYREGSLPLERLAPETVEAMKAGVGAVVAHALPSVGLLDDALRKACEERDKLREGLKHELADHEAFVDELLENTDDEPHMSDTPEDYAVRYVRRLEAEAARLRELLNEARIADPGDDAPEDRDRTLNPGDDVLDAQGGNPW